MLVLHLLVRATTLQLLKLPIKGKLILLIDTHYQLKRISFFCYRHSSTINYGSFETVTISLKLVLLSTLIFGFSPEEQDPNKDKLLIEIISYVINRGHYDPREINDSFSENAFMNYLESLDGQHRFFLQSDIRTFESFRFKIDDEIKNAQINFFDLTFLRLKKRMKQVESFYSEI